MAYACVRVQFEIGHESVVRDIPTKEGFTHDWEVFVRGADNAEIYHFVDKVVFHLHESFPNSKRTIKVPPFLVKESGYAGFNLPIDIYFKTKDDERKRRIYYDLTLQEVGPKTINIIKEKVDFKNPNEEFRRKLIKGGGIGVGENNERNANQQDSNRRLQLSEIKNTNKLKETIFKTAGVKINSSFTNLFGTPLLQTTKNISNSKTKLFNEKSSFQGSEGTAYKCNEKVKQKDERLVDKEKSSKSSKSSKDKNKVKDSADNFKLNNETTKGNQKNNATTNLKSSERQTTKDIEKDEQKVVAKTESEFNDVSVHKDVKIKIHKSVKVKDEAEGHSKITDFSKADINEDNKLLIKAEKSKNKKLRNRDGERHKKHKKKSKNKDLESNDCKHKKDKSRDLKIETSNIMPVRENVSARNSIVEQNNSHSSSEESVTIKTVFPSVLRETNRTSPLISSKNYIDSFNTVPLSPLPKSPTRHQKGGGNFIKISPEKLQRQSASPKFVSTHRDVPPDLSPPSLIPKIEPLSPTPSPKQRACSSSPSKYRMTSESPLPPPQLSPPRLTSFSPITSPKKPSTPSSEGQMSTDRHTVSTLGINEYSDPISTSDASVAYTDDERSRSSSTEDSSPRKRKSNKEDKARRFSSLKKKHKNMNQDEDNGEYIKSRKRKKKSRRDCIHKKARPLSFYENTSNSAIEESSHREESLSSDCVEESHSVHTSPDPTTSNRLPFDSEEQNFTEEYVSQLKELQKRIMQLSNNCDLQKIIHIVSESGNFEINQRTFDFDLVTLDRATVKQLQDVFVKNTS